MIPHESSLEDKCPFDMGSVFADYLSDSCKINSRILQSPVMNSGKQSTVAQAQILKVHKDIIMSLF